MIHWPMPERNETWKFLEKLLEEKKAKAIGVGNFTIRHLKELAEIATITPAINQVEHNPYRNRKDIIEYCKEKGIELEGYCPLTRGQKLDDSKLIEIAKKYNKTTAQLLIRWALQHNIICIPKSKTPSRIEENFNVFDFEISQEDMDNMDSWNEDLIITRDPEQMQ
jgi:diketogulonate reductase-like aldo/keto reductase